MDWKVGNALSRDVERQHLNKILAEIRSAIDNAAATTPKTNTVTNTVTTKYAISNFILTLAGAVTGSATVNGTGDVTITTALAGDVGIEEAPIDNQYYWRWNGEWFPVPSDTAAKLINDTNIAPINFSWGDASPTTIYTVVKDAIVDLVQVVIRTAFDGTSPQISVGLVGDEELLMPIAYNDPTVASTYEVSPDVLLAAGDHIIITIVPGAGASAGEGQVLLSLVNS